MASYLNIFMHSNKVSQSFELVQIKLCARILFDFRFPFFFSFSIHFIFVIVVVVVVVVLLLKRVVLIGLHVCDVCMCSCVSVSWSSRTCDLCLFFSMKVGFSSFCNIFNYPIRIRTLDISCSFLSSFILLACCRYNVTHRESLFYISAFFFVYVIHIINLSLFHAPRFPLIPISLDISSAC